MAGSSSSLPSAHRGSCAEAAFRGNRISAGVVVLWGWFTTIGSVRWGYHGVQRYNLPMSWGYRLPFLYLRDGFKSFFSSSKNTAKDDLDELFPLTTPQT